MVTRLLKSLGHVFLSTVLASAVVLTALHQTFWRYEPVSLDQTRQAVHLITGPYGSCSGVMVAPNKMLTAAHCDRLGDIKVNGKPTAVINYDVQKDLMLLLVDVPCPCVSLPDFELGENLPVAIVGFPIGLTKATTMGETAGYVDHPELPDQKDYAIYSASVEGGYSGGGIFYFHEGKWYLMGIVSAGSKTLTVAANTIMMLNFLIKENISPDVR